MDGIFAYLIISALSLAILYAVIQAAVKSALIAHYKVIRWYEATGEWLPRTGTSREAPSDFGSHPDSPMKRPGSLN